MRRVARILVDVLLAVLAIACWAIGLILGYAGETAFAVVCIASGCLAMFFATERWEP